MSRMITLSTMKCESGDISIRRAENNGTDIYWGTANGIPVCSSYNPDILQDALSDVAAAGDFDGKKD